MTARATKARVRVPKRTWYLGYDGSYTLSRFPFSIANDTENDFLQTGEKYSIVDIEESLVTRGLFPALKPWEFVKLTITVSKPKKARRART